MKTYYYSLDDKNRITALSQNAWLGEEQPSVQLETDVGFILGFYGVKNGKIYEIGFDKTYIEQQELENKKHRINKLKQWLADTDWKVVVNAEMIQAGLEPKYPNLHQERQAWRDEINALEV
jgi:hypothetical protein